MTSAELFLGVIRYLAEIAAGIWYLTLTVAALAVTVLGVALLERRDRKASPRAKK